MARDLLRRWRSRAVSGRESLVGESVTVIHAEDGLPKRPGTLAIRHPNAGTNDWLSLQRRVAHNEQQGLCWRRGEDKSETDAQK